jgi:hypothetical protein
MMLRSRSLIFSRPGSGRSCRILRCHRAGSGMLLIPLRAAMRRSGSSVFCPEGARFGNAHAARLGAVSHRTDRPLQAHSCEGIKPRVNPGLGYAFLATSGHGSEMSELQTLRDEEPDNRSFPHAPSTRSIVSAKSSPRVSLGLCRRGFSIPRSAQSRMWTASCSWQMAVPHT